MTNVPVTISDFHNAEAIWGKDLASLKGKSVRIQPKTVVVDPTKVNIDKKLVMSLDIFYLGNMMFLLSITRRIQMYMVTHVKDRKTETIKVALKSQLSAYHAKGFEVQIILVDGEGAMISMQEYLESVGITVSSTARNEHVPEVERAIRHVKERVRGIYNTLPYKTSQQMLKYMVYYVCMMINIMPKANSAGGISAREAFTGIKTDYQRDIKIGFGEYVQVYDEDRVTNTMRERTIGALSLGPTGNLQGTYLFLSLSTWDVIRRRTWTIIPITKEIIALINKRAESHRGVGQEIDDGDLWNENLPDQQEVPELPYDQQDIQIAGPAEEHNVENAENEDIDVIDLTENEEIVMDGDPPVVDEALEFMEPAEELAEAQPEEHLENQPGEIRFGGHNLRPNRSNWRERYGHVVLANLSIDKANRLYGYEAAESVMKEMKQMHEKKVWEVVEYDNLTSQEKAGIIKSLLFLKRKRDGRLKARLVADGRMQERSVDYDVAAPTVSTESLFMIAVINAREKRHVVTVDVEGAYLNALMDRTVIMEVSGQQEAALTYLYPEHYESYERYGKIYVKLKKALYGTIEAAKLWYENLSTYLKSAGFVANMKDRCVLNKGERQNQVTISIHVDDLKISSKNRTSIDETLSGLRKEYININVQEGAILDYLGMVFDYSEEGAVSISMGSMVGELLEAIEVNASEMAKTPAATNLFESDDSSQLLGTKETKRFHSAVALALYLAKRGRPDILTVVSLLSTKVQKPTFEDLKKLKRLGAYLNGTKELKLRLSSTGNLSIYTYVDASYGVHLDGKSHTGGMDTFGIGAFASTSTKQKIVTKSSSEAELVGISDCLSPLISNKCFMEYQGYEIGPIKLAQDNKSTIVMAKTGKPIGKRTRHISIRHFFIKDRIDSNEVELVYLRTEDMVADYFTKPLQGALFVKLRDIIMGVKKNKDAVIKG